MYKWKKAALFALGGGSYVGLEYLWRGRSHPSMFLTGGTCFLLLGKIGRLKLPQPLRALAGGGMITLAELAAGCIFNRRWQIWDYRGIRGNYLGQIAVPFSALWVGLAALGETLYKAADRLLELPCLSRRWRETE